MTRARGRLRGSSCPLGRVSLRSEERRPGHCGVSGVGHGHGGRAGAESGGLCPEQGLSGLPHEVTRAPGRSSGATEGSRGSGLTPAGPRGRGGRAAGRRGTGGAGSGQREARPLARFPGRCRLSAPAGQLCAQVWGWEGAAGGARRARAPGTRALRQVRGRCADRPRGRPRRTCAASRSPFRLLAGRTVSLSREGIRV